MNASPDIGRVVDWLRTLSPPQTQAARPELRSELRADSRAVEAGDIFVAMPGVLAGKSADGRSFMDQARARGAAAVLLEELGWSAHDVGVPVLAVRDLRQKIGAIASAYYGNDEAGLRCIGVTGTNGKTSCSLWIAQLLNLAGTRCAVLGTLGNGFPGEDFVDAALTTPDAVALQCSVHRLTERGARALAMEVSSIGLEQDRVAGIGFEVALFTNLTRDHLDYHGTMAAYEAAKAQLFDWPTLTHAVINLDDEAGRRLFDRLAREARPGLQLTAYTMQGRTSAGAHRTLAAANLRATPAGMSFDLHGDGRVLPIITPLVGEFNVANLLGVIGVALACGIALEKIPAWVSQLTPPPGRMQCAGGKGAPLAVIDYAHTPDALEQALRALQPLAAARDGKLWAVFGAGGDRDRGKRATMGRVAAQLADSVVLTSDNPRTEEPTQILADIAAGIGSVRSYRSVVDRAQAIADAIRQADARDVVLVAGKGHESYQDIGGAKRPFSDEREVRSALAARTAKSSEAMPC